VIANEPAFVANGVDVNVLPRVAARLTRARLASAGRRTGYQLAIRAADAEGRQWPETAGEL